MNDKGLLGEKRNFECSQRISAYSSVLRMLNRCAVEESCQPRWYMLSVVI